MFIIKGSRHNRYAHDEPNLCSALSYAHIQYAVFVDLYFSHYLTTSTALYIEVITVLFFIYDGEFVFCICIRFIVF